jgi:transcriptional regulator with PAS, ATPase and Fis domain
MIEQEAEHFRLAAPSPPGKQLLQQLLCHPWKGNVRELRSTAKRFVLGLPPLSAAVINRHDLEINLKTRLQQMEKSLIEESLRQHDHCVDSVAIALGVAKRTLYHRIKHLGISLS